MDVFSDEDEAIARNSGYGLLKEER